MFQNKQFETVTLGHYYMLEPSQVIIDAVNEAYKDYEISNKAEGALFFKSPAAKADWSCYEYLFTDNIGHSFYK